MFLQPNNNSDLQGGDAYDCPDLKDKMKVTLTIQNKTEGI